MKKFIEAALVLVFHFIADVHIFGSRRQTTYTSDTNIAHFTAGIDTGRL